MALTQTMPVPTTPSSAMEIIKDTGAEKLLMSCLGLLARVYPRGLTARELVDELAQEDEKFDLTSSLLSSKLNTIFRRLHNERGAPTPKQLTDLPMTRKMTEDKRKRLIYHFVPSEAQKPSVISPESPTPDATPDASNSHPAKDSVEVQKEAVHDSLQDTQPENPQGSQHEPESTPKLTDDNSTATIGVPSRPVSPVERTVGPATPDTPTSPKRKLDEKPESRKKYTRSSFNPYYDALTLDIQLPQLATAPQSPAVWSQEMCEFEAPELVDLNVLDACC